jgi:hypothetical protein
MIVLSDVATHTMPWYGAIISIQPMPLTQTQTKSVCHWPKQETTIGLGRVDSVEWIDDEWQC